MAFTYYFFKGVDDLLQIHKYLRDLNKKELSTLGQVLGLSHATVTNRREGSSASEYCDNILVAWLLGQDRVLKSGKPSWRTLIRALRSNHLRHNGIADKIEREMFLHQGKGTTLL